MIHKEIFIKIQNSQYLFLLGSILIPELSIETK